MKLRSISTLLFLVCIAAPVCGKVPQWLRDVAAQPQPPQKAELEAIQLLSEVELEVHSDGRMTRRVREAFRILRGEGESRALLRVTYDSWTRVKDMHVWTIPAAGAVSEVSMRDAVDAAIGTGADTITDARGKLLQAQDAHPGAVVGHEYEVEISPLQQADTFDIQDTIPVLEARYLLRIPSGWVVTSNWVNHATVEPEHADSRSWRWVVRDMPAVVSEPNMPSWRSVAGHLQLAFAPSGSVPELSTWQGIGAWYARLAQERLKPSDAIRAKVAELTRDSKSPVEKLRALASYVQTDVRYVAVELGIGGFQPHAVAEVFANRFGDCKDKASLLGAMLAVAGIDSTTVLVNIDRSAVGPATPPGLAFNHAILAVSIPRDARTPDLLAIGDGPDGNPLLFFDPTDEVTPVGRLSGSLQGAYGLLAMKEGGVLAQLPRVSYRDSGVRRTGQLKLGEKGELSGNFVEVLTGDQASLQRHVLRAATSEADLIKPVEARLGASLVQFRVTSVTASNQKALQLPFEWRYSLVADSYARRAGDLLTVRPRVVGVKAENLLKDNTPRVHDLMFSEARMDQDEITIELPAGYAVDSLPDPVDIDVGFAAYHSRTEATGSQLLYKRTYELRELQLPAAKFADFLRFNQAITRDERAVAVLKITAVK